MLAFARASRAFALWAALTGAACGAPERVVSINLCTDQLALAIAAPGQLVSVTHMSHEPENSARHLEAAQLPGNTARAEEVYLMKPDLVLAGTFTSHATIHMLEGLGIPVERFQPANALSDIPERMRQMGVALGREAAGEAMAAAFEAELAALSGIQSERLRAAILYVNSFVAGEDTLASDILQAAGFANVVLEAGHESIRRLSLEQIILLAPDVIFRGSDYPGQARGEGAMTHPALEAVGARVIAGALDRAWVCGTEHTLEAVRRMTDIRLRLEAE